MSGLFEPAFDLKAPEKVVAPMLFNSPHSGRNYPDKFLAASKLDPDTLRRSEDCYVEELFAGVVGLGLPLFQAYFPRAYLDVNREPFELDPEMFDEPLPETANIHSQRVAGGLGTIPRIVAEATEIYDSQLSFAEAEHRISQIYMPYHGELYALLRGLRRGFGAALLVDCHSMPSSVRGQIEPRPDFVLGDRFGTSCASGIIDAAHASLRALGFSVVRNRPYAGGFITQSYGRPGDGFHALQIE
ncbi:MAG: N-formylglutamate amidohydrolase, partial [Alphaproteobacteria bacterium]